MLTFAELRAREFSRLDAQHHAYVDYTGSALYADSQIEAHRALLAGGIFGNPHSESRSSKESTEQIDRARELVLKFFGVDASTHAVIFTANTSAAIKLVAESYPFTPDTTFLLSADNHNSVNGMREYARRAGAKIRAFPLDDQLRLSTELWPDGPGVFAFPAQSNFSGVLHPISLIDRAHDRGFDVLLDAAAFASSHALNLRNVDYTVLSFYKLFGYPTGVGALIARRDALAKLSRPWFAGGTVLYASVQADTHRLKPGPDSFEDGTPNFLGIAALPAGFALLDEIGMPRITDHVHRLTRMFLDEIGEDVRIYGPRNVVGRGSTVAFNIEGVPYWEVEAHARRANVSLRGGCFCNPGASEAAFGLTSTQIRGCFDRLGEEFTVERFASCLDAPVGAVRVSFGAANNEEDVWRCLEVVRELTAGQASACSRTAD